MDFDNWMLTKDPKYRPTDDTVALRRLRECWDAAQKQRASEIATVRRLNLALTKNAMNRPKDCPNCNTWDENASLKTSAGNAAIQLRKLGKRLAELLDEDQWAECEALLIAAGLTHNA